MRFIIQMTDASKLSPSIGHHCSSEEAEKVIAKLLLPSRKSIQLFYIRSSTPWKLASKELVNTYRSLELSAKENTKKKLLAAKNPDFIA